MVDVSMPEPHGEIFVYNTPVSYYLAPLYNLTKNAFVQAKSQAWRNGFVSQ